MSSRRQAAVMIGVAVLIVSAVFGSVVWRSIEWSERGWIGIAFFPAGEDSPAFLKSRGIGPGGVFMVMPDSPAERAGITERERILEIEGIPLGDEERLVRLDESLRSGDTITYTIEEDGESRLVEVQLESPLRSAVVTTGMVTGLIVALIFFMIGAFVLSRRPGDRSARIFFAITVVASISLATTGLLNIESGTMRGVTAQTNSLTLPFIALISFLLAPLLAHLSLVFPRPRPILREVPEVFRWIYSVPVWFLLNMLLAIVFGGAVDGDLTMTVQGKTMEVLLPDEVRRAILAAFAIGAVAVVIAWTIALRRRGWRWPVVYRNPALVVASWLFLVSPLLISLAELELFNRGSKALLGLGAIGVPMLGFLVLPIVTCVNFYRSYRESDIEEKHQLRWPLWAMIVGIGGRVLISLVSFALVLYSFIRWGDAFPAPSFLIGADVASKLFYLLIPVAFAFAILKYRLMEIDLIIRKTIVYGIVSGIVAFLWLALAGGIGALLVQTTHIENQTVAVAATLLVGLLFVPLRNRLQRLVDHRYHKGEEGLTTVERRIGRDIANSSDLSSLLRSTAIDVQQALETSTVAFLLPGANGGSRLGGGVGLPEKTNADIDFERLASLLSVSSHEEWNFDDETSEALRRMRATTLVPLRRRGALVGLLLLGRRIDRRELSAAERGFLGSIADQIAVGIDNLLREDDEEEFEQARDIQKALLPAELPQMPGVRIAGSWHPARAVGGDYFDVIRLDDRSVGICIADVAGKGMPAALLMSNLQAVVRAMAARDASPAALCNKVRNIITTNLSGGKFITFFYCLIDLETRQLRWSNAGHLIPVLISSDGSVLRLDEGGPAFARLFSGLDYNEGSIEYASGDRLLLFTDGVTEAENERGEQLGEQPLIDHLIGSAHLRGADEMQAAVLDLVKAHAAGPFSDDVTLVAVSWD